MRRKEREVTDQNIIDEIIRACDICHLGLNDNGRVYIVPLNFGFLNENGKRVLYFHSAKEGKKIDLIKENGYAGFQMNTGYELVSGEKACDYTAKFRSVAGGGKISVVQSEEEKMSGLRAVMNSTAGEKNWQYNEKWLNAVCIIKLEIGEISCKENI